MGEKDQQSYCVYQDHSVFKSLPDKVLQWETYHGIDTGLLAGMRRTPSEVFINQKEKGLIMKRAYASKGLRFPVISPIPNGHRD